MKQYKTPIAITALTSLCLLALVACAPPQVNLERADLAKITTTGFRIDMNLAIFNPNTYTFPLQSVGWDLDLYRAPFTAGTVRTNNQISANRTTAVRVPLGVRFASAKASVQKFLAGNDIPWGIDGKCDFNTPAGPVFVKFAKDGLWNNPLKNRRSSIDAHEQRHVATSPDDYVEEPLIQIALQPID